MKRCDIEIRRVDPGSRDVVLLPRTDDGNKFYLANHDLRSFGSALVPSDRLPELFTRLFHDYLSFAVYQL